jgi:CBS domain-containing protein
MTVRQIIANKPKVYAVRPEDTVFDALRLMGDHNIGAVIVLDGSAITGIMSERDYARKVILLGRSSHDLRVTDIMTSPVVCADPEWSTHDCMRMMTDHRVRHLPVVEAGRLVGVVSIGDVVRSVLEEQAQTIQTLESYISSGG